MSAVVSRTAPGACAPPPVAAPPPADAQDRFASSRQALQDWLHIAQTPGLGPVSAAKLLRAFGSPRAALAAGRTAWASVLNARLAQALHTAQGQAATLAEAAWHWQATAPQRGILTLDHPRYPHTLLQTPDPPLVLYATGRLTLLQAPSLAIVGSRRPSAQGHDNARHFAQALAEAGWTIVSGLALGIDSAAHEGALRGGAAGSIAVMATGIDRVYPAQHHALAKRLSQEGLILSEYPLGTPPLRSHFPRRNRLIAGLSQGTLVIEATPSSGSLITARLAADLGREVFALPGSIHTPQARGCHALIQQGAKLVGCVQDVLDELPLANTTPPHRTRPAVKTQPVAQPPPPAADHEASPVLRALGFEPTDLDTLCVRTGQNAATLHIELLSLELQGHICRLPGQRFVRNART